MYLTSSELYNSIEIEPPYSRTLAALADAHDEAFLVTRVADSDGMEPSDLLHAMQQ